MRGQNLRSRAVGINNQPLTFWKSPSRFHTHLSQTFPHLCTQMADPSVGVVGINYRSLALLLSHLSSSHLLTLVCRWGTPPLAWWASSTAPLRLILLLAGAPASLFTLPHTVYTFAPCRLQTLLSARLWGPSTALLPAPPAFLPPHFLPLNICPIVNFHPLFCCLPPMAVADPSVGVVTALSPSRSHTHLSHSCSHLCAQMVDPSVGVVGIKHRPLPHSRHPALSPHVPPRLPTLVHADGGPISRRCGHQVPPRCPPLLSPCSLSPCSRKLSPHIPPLFPTLVCRWRTPLSAWWASSTAPWPAPAATGSLRSRPWTRGVKRQYKTLYATGQHCTNKA